MLMEVLLYFRGTHPHRTATTAPRGTDTRTGGSDLEGEAWILFGGRGTWARTTRVHKASRSPVTALNERRARHGVQKILKGD